MAEQEPIKWITLNGRHIPIYEDGSIGMPKPKIAGNYGKQTPEMESMALQVGIKMQKEFPELLADQFEIRFEKYMGSDYGDGGRDYIDLNGAALKKLLKEPYDQEIHRQTYRGVVAHELTHTMQDRLNTALGLKGDEREKNLDRMWDNIIRRYSKDRNMDPEDVKRIDGILASYYGKSRIGATATEKMAVAVEMAYHTGGNKRIEGLGEYVLQEFRSEIDKNDVRYKKRTK